MLTTLLAAALLTAQPANAQPTAPEPDATAITLTIDGDPHPLQPGQTTTITIDGKPHQVRVDLPTRTRYTNKHITFDYPAAFTAHPRQNLDDGIFITQINASNVNSIVYEFDTAIPLPVLFDGVVAQYQDETFERQTGDISLEADIATLQGRYIQVSISGAYLRQEYYRISNGTEAVIIMIQDVRDTPDQPTKDFTALRQSIAKTLTTNQP